ncbi:MAG: hypothetical protein JWQ49_5211 [Edaphobacter sp.]|jgi:hypothetical protein|nr:hypothetical protein [Edaphobacter sp.]
MEQAARPFTLNRRFPYLASINRLANIDVANYHALQATLTQKAMHGLDFTAGYTYAHALDDSSSNFNANMLPVITHVLACSTETATSISVTGSRSLAVTAFQEERGSGRLCKDDSRIQSSRSRQGCHRAFRM